MARCNVTLHTRKRWFFWPALVAIVVLGKLGVLRSQDRAGRWLADHAMVIEVR